jgi:phosphoribosylformimino-5-aminoimidazole carboxamide ribotide isomerase
MRIIIAIDIIEGKCVRLTKGDYSTRKVYNADPLDMAKQIEDHGLKYLHLVDLDGAKSKKVINHRVLEKIVSKTSLTVDFGGGIRSYDDLRIAFGCGASQVTCGTISASEPAMFLDWLGMFGADKIILGADSVNRKILTEGWLENTETDIIDFVKSYVLKGVRYTVCTDIEKDGMLLGPSVSLYKDILEAVSINLIASGGVTTEDDIMELRGLGCEGAIIGKALYEGLLNLKQISRLC